MCRRSDAPAHRKYACPGIGLQGKWDSNPTFAGLPEVSLKFTTGSNCLRESSRPGVESVTGKYPVHSPLMQKLVVRAIVRRIAD